MGIPEAKLIDQGGGVLPEHDGWFIVNVADTLSYRHPLAGQYQSFENPKTARFPHYGIGIHVLWPGQPNAMYLAPELRRRSRSRMAAKRSRSRTQDDNGIPASSAAAAKPRFSASVNRI